MPYYASGDINSFEELTLTNYGIKRDTGFFKQTKGLNVVTGAEVIKIDRDKKRITVRMLSTGITENHIYDRLVLAVGSTPIKPPFPAAESPNIPDSIAFLIALMIKSEDTPSPSSETL